MTSSAQTDKGLILTATLEPGEMLVKSLVPATSTFWQFLCAMALITTVAAGMMIDASTGTSRMLWTAVTFGAAWHAARDLFRKSRLMSAQWTLTNRRLIGPSQAWNLQDITRVNSFLHEVSFIAGPGEKATIRYLPSASAAAFAVKAAKQALR